MKCCVLINSIIVVKEAELSNAGSRSHWDEMCHWPDVSNHGRTFSAMLANQPNALYLSSSNRRVRTWSNISRWNYHVEYVNGNDNDYGPVMTCINFTPDVWLDSSLFINYLFLRFKIDWLVLDSIPQYTACPDPDSWPHSETMTWFSENCLQCTWADQTFLERGAHR